MSRPKEPTKTPIDCVGSVAAKQDIRKRVARLVSTLLKEYPKCEEMIAFALEGERVDVVAHEEKRKRKERTTNGG
jgi:lambda repressor-like predicted transcriptional regulator